MGVYIMFINNKKYYMVSYSKLSINCRCKESGSYIQMVAYSTSYTLKMKETELPFHHKVDLQFRTMYLILC